MNEREEKLQKALQTIISFEPVFSDGLCYYEDFDMDGNYVGTHYIDPATIIQQMVSIAQKAL